MAREAFGAQARRYRRALRFLAQKPDAEELWPIAREAMHRVAEDGSEIEEAWAAACVDQGWPDPREEANRG